ncbi:uncharacterized protein [Ptychodera flava]|uniref:uncharacterized protein n=1 Tax=Ptychodera flava TaxID=63121 RepID=UPI00396A0AAF
MVMIDKHEAGSINSLRPAGVCDPGLRALGRHKCGHGGRGGRPSSSYLSAGQSESYGKPHGTCKRGSGGGGSYGGAGGGALYIESNFVELEGIISANGEDATGSSSGGGAGGSIFIFTNLLLGGGRISAVGGRGGTNGGGGAGGRISIEHQFENLFTGQVFANGGRPGKYHVHDQGHQRLLESVCTLRQTGRSVT